METTAERSYWINSADAAIDKLQRKRNWTPEETELFRSTHRETVASVLANPITFVQADDHKGGHMPILVPCPASVYRDIGEPDGCCAKQLNTSVVIDSQEVKDQQRSKPPKTPKQKKPSNNNSTTDIKRSGSSPAVPTAKKQQQQQHSFASYSTAMKSAPSSTSSSPYVHSAAPTLQPSSVPIFSLGTTTSAAFM